MAKNLRNTILRLEDKIKTYVEERANNPVETGNTFCDWCLVHLFELNEDERIEASKYGGVNDNSLDAMFEFNEKVYIIQSKYGSSHKWEGVAKFIADIKRLAKGEVVGNRQEILEAAAIIKDAISEEKEIRVFYLTNKEFTEFEEKKITEIQNELSAVYFNFITEILDLQGIKIYLEDKLNDIPKRFDGRQLPLGVIKYLQADDTYLAEVSLRDFFSFVNAGDDFLYYSNIRNYLKKTSVNKGMEQTLEKEAHYFWYYNNGVTIVCDNVEPVNKLLKLTTPQIVNGCQTANSIKQFFRRKSNEEKLNIHGKLLVKIIEDPNRQKRKNVTKYTNTQNAVKGKDFYALDNFQKELQQKLGELGYFYEIQAGSRLLQKGNFKGQDKYAYLLPEKYDNIMIAKEVIQAYTAGMKQMPGFAYGNPSKLTPSDDSYAEFVEDAPDSVEYFLYPYLVLKYAKTNLGYNNKSRDFRRSASLLYVNTYFLTLVKILVETGSLVRYEENPLSISEKTLEKVFNNQDLNTKILALTDVVLDNYFEDSTIDNHVGDNLGNFLKRTIDSKDKKVVRDILSNKIENALKKPKNADVIECFK